MLVLLTW